MTDKSGPAYPCTIWRGDEAFPCSGLTKREYFAAAALQGLLAAGPHDCTYQQLAEDAVVCAGALVNILQRTAK
jgi:hypothetical protein